MSMDANRDTKAFTSPSVVYIQGSSGIPQLMTRFYPAHDSNNPSVSSLLSVEIYSNTDL